MTTTTSGYKVTDRVSVKRPEGGITIPVYAPAEDGQVVADKYNRPVVVAWEQSYVGHVLSTYERNGYDDSDFYAVVYDEATDSIKHVEYASTRGYTYDCGARVDTTEEVKAKAREVLRRASFARITSAAAAAAKEPEKGKTVRVVKGRKVPVGTEGVVVWKGVDSYNPGKWSGPKYRVGVKDAEGTVHWTAASNVEVVDPQDWMADWSAMEHEAASYARGDHWRQY